MPEKEDSYSKKLYIERIFPEDLKSYFVTHLVVQHQDDAFIISYFELWPPAILADSDEDRKKALDVIKQVTANCVARLIVPSNKMKDFISAMQKNYEIYEKGKAEDKIR